MRHDARFAVLRLLPMPDMMLRFFDEPPMPHRIH